MTTLDATADSESLSTIKQVIYDVADNLSEETTFKFVFLFYDFLSNEFLQLFFQSSTAKREKIFCLVKDVLVQKQLSFCLAPNIWTELLFLTKNYNFLRMFNTCKHEMKHRMLRGAQLFSSEFRRYLVSLADEMTDDDVHNIWRRLYPNNTDFPVQPEHLFHHMLKEQLISEVNLNELQEHFKALQRSDLQRKTEKYLERTGKRLGNSYYDLSLDSRTGYCGRALIFNNKTFKKTPPSEYVLDPSRSLEDRKGTEKDADSLVKLWESFGIQPQVVPDAGIVEFKKHLNDFLNEDLSSVKIIVICILSHGREGAVLCADRVPVKLSYVETLLGTSEKLAQIPKLLFVQACQGNKWQIKGTSPTIAESFQCDGPSSVSSDNLPVPQFSDMLVGISTVPGFLSAREEEYGTHFIQTLVEVLELSGDQQDLSSLVTQVNRKVSNKWACYCHKKENQSDRCLDVVQMPTFHNQLTKSLTFRKVVSATSLVLAT